MAVNVNGTKIGYGAPVAAALVLDQAKKRQVPWPASQPPVKPSAAAGLVILAYLRTHTERMKSLDPMVRRDEPDAVHQMRVTTRRLRSTLRSFRHIIHREGTRRLAAELTWLGTVLGEARDAEVLAGHLQRELRRTPPEQVIGPVQARVQGHCASVRAAARTQLLAALDSDRYFSLLDDLDWLLNDPPFTAQAAMPAAEVLPAAARRALRQAGRQMHRATGVPAGQLRNEALHQARKSARRARYASEAMAPAAGKKARRFTKQMKKVQSVLGEYQDTVIARQVARELGIRAHLAGENAFSYGLLYERDVCHGHRLQVQAQRAWKRASRPRYRRWMR
jgi:CHAD domain-containing protein